MKTISDYTIYCTAEQTRKALSLGAPITTCGYYFKQQVGCNTISDTDLHIIPTAEQMIGWLEEQLNVREIFIRRYGNWGYEVYIDPYYHLEENGFASRKEATIAAIDAALGYLTNKK